MAKANAFGLGDMEFGWGDHICAVFDEPGQQMSIMPSFMAQGLDNGQCCIWISAERSAARFRKALSELVYDLPALEVSGQLVIIPNIDFYLTEGLFDPQRGMELVQTLIAEGQRKGFSAMRMTYDVAWLSETAVNSKLWRQYGEAIAQAVSGLPVVVVSQHDSFRLSAIDLFTALRTHPLVIFGDTLYESPLVLAVFGATPHAVM